MGSIGYGKWFCALCGLLLSVSVEVEVVGSIGYRKWFCALCGLLLSVSSEVGWWDPLATANGSVS